MDPVLNTNLIQILIYEAASKTALEKTLYRVWRTTGQKVERTSVVPLLQQVIARLLPHRLVVRGVSETPEEQLQEVPLAHQRNGLFPQTCLVSDVFQLRIAQDELRVANLQRRRVVQKGRDISQKEVPTLELLVDHIVSHSMLETSSCHVPHGHAAHVVDKRTVLTWIALR